MAFYLKYRPKNVEELDISSVRDSLSKIIKSGNIPHACLFSGPKGTGKTSAARILAKVINCEDRRKNSAISCDKCKECKSIKNGSNLDVIEIDAASHRGIDDIRALRDAVKLAPSGKGSKIYIIDEAHMLTTEASNALLKTLEEPPDHVYFVLATTNPEKLISTIRSRTTNILFNKATEDEVVRSLQRPVKGEKIKVNEEVLKIISRSADGSFRDAVKILEQMVSENISFEQKSVEKYLKKENSRIDSLLNFFSKKDATSSLEHIGKMVDSGVSIKVFSKDLLIRLREGLLAEVGIGENNIEGLEKQDLISLIEVISISRQEISDSLIEQLPLEMAIIKWCQGKKEMGNKMNEKIATNETLEEPVEKISETVKKDKIKKKVEKIKPSNEIEEPNEEISLKDVREISDEVWQKILMAVKPINMSVEALLRAAKPTGFNGKDLTLNVFYRFHKERLEENNHRKTLEDVAGKIFGTPVRVRCTLAEAPVKITKEEKQKETVLTDGEDKDIIKAAEEIFGN